MVAIATVVLLVLASLINYLIVYQKNRFLGSIIYMILGMGAIYADKANAYIGFVILIAGFASLIYVIGEKTR